jgi:enoyl-CoA hydratase/carnithine racemase
MSHKGLADAPQFLDVAFDDGIAVATFRRPERRNALNVGLVREIGEVTAVVAQSEQIRALVLTGDEQAFSSGADLKETPPPHFVEELNAILTRLENLGKPTIAAISGWCIAGGLELAMVCDLRVATTDARIGDWHARINSIGGAGAIPRLVRLVGLARAKELIYTGAAVSGEEAWRIGLVNRLCEPGEQLEAALALAREIAAGNAITFRYQKRALHAAADRELYAALAESLALQEEVKGALGDEFGAALFAARKAEQARTGG